ncbi:MAG: DUF302 domain-containing protein [Acidimicrobiales bacterium]
MTKRSPRSVEDTVARFVRLIDAKGLRLFAVIDQRHEALRVGLDLRATTLVLFGSPLVGTPVMDAVPLAALELPLKVLVWADGNDTNVSYVSPASLARRCGLSEDQEKSLAGIDQLTDALIAS